MTTTIDALVEAALKRAFGLGQTYWQQADSGFTSHHKKAEATRQNFLVLCEETLAALAQARAEQAEPVAEVREDKRSGKLFIATLGDAELEPGTKLYTAPPAAPAKLEPLTEVEVQRLIAAHGSSATPSEDNNYTTGDYPLLRAVEAAHNAKLAAPQPAAQVVELPDGCECRRCIKEKNLNHDGIPLDMVQMIVCPTCGNKMCPKASDHRNGCTNSNAAGQPGSVYSSMKPPEKGGA